MHASLLVALTILGLTQGAPTPQRLDTSSVDPSLNAPSIEPPSFNATGIDTTLHRRAIDSLDNDSLNLTGIDTTLHRRANLSGAPKCNLGNYPSFTEGAARDGKAYLAGFGNTYLGADGHTCHLLSCSYGTGISLCNDGDGVYTITGSDLASEVQSLYEACDPDGADGNRNDYAGAMQAFYDDNHNVLVQGGFSC